VHLFTIADFESFCDSHSIRILERVVMRDGRRVRFATNLRGSLAVFGSSGWMKRGIIGLMDEQIEAAEWSTHADSPQYRAATSTPGTGC
jgi:hypothetical protein